MSKFQSSICCGTGGEDYCVRGCHKKLSSSIFRVEGEHVLNSALFFYDHPNVLVF
jgi:hypothetical protein